LEKELKSLSIKMATLVASNQLEEVPSLSNAIASRKKQIKEIECS